MQTEQYEVYWKNYYNILGLSPRANAQEIKRAYRRLAPKYHPDRAEDCLASNRMAEINEAYEVLSVSNRRAKYDERFKSIYSRQLTVEEALEAELTEAAISRLARERLRNRWIERILVSIIRTTLRILSVPFFCASYIGSSYSLANLLLAWLIYLLICIMMLCGILLWSGMP